MKSRPRPYGLLGVPNDLGNLTTPQLPERLSSSSVAQPWRLRQPQ
jgi:hypothetical protein